VLGDIWLGDVVRALAVLRPIDEESADILRALGFHVATQAHRAAAPTTASEDAEGASDVQSAEVRYGSARSTPDEPPAKRHRDGPPLGTDGDAEIPLLEPLTREPLTPSQREVKPLALPGPEHVTPVLPYTSLFAHRSTAAILWAAMSQNVEGGDLDMDAVIDVIAKGRPVDRLPRRRTRTLRFGVEVLVDLSEGMQPFRRDQIELVESIRRLAGSGQTRVTYFADAPMRGAGSGAAWTWDEYRAPSPRTRLIVLSDLGIGGPPLSPHTALPEEWTEFVDYVRQQDCDVIAVVPYPRHRWPPAISSLLPMLQWDQITTTAVAFQTAGSP
jgi:hypothetical protein